MEFGAAVVSRLLPVLAGLFKWHRIGTGLGLTSAHKDSITGSSEFSGIAQFISSILGVGKTTVARALGHFGDIWCF